MAEQSEEITEPATQDAEIVDVLPDDLDLSRIEGPYEFPNNNRRRIPAVLYLVIGAAVVFGYLAIRSSGPILMNGGLLLGGIALIVFGIYGLLAGRNLAVDEQQALTAATKAAGFPIGHASAQMSWAGLLSRPMWRILAYSAENPPTMRCMVFVDGVDGEVLDSIVEENPEDWTEYGDSAEL